MKRYFDITDLVHFALINRNVSGIQRVQVEVIGQLARATTGNDIFCLFAVDRFTPIVACNARELFGQGQYTADRFLESLGLDRVGGCFTERELYDYLGRFPKRSLLRVAKKAEMIILRRLWPAAARHRLGFPAEPAQKSSAPTRVTLWRLNRLEKGDTLILLGPNWNATAVQRFARKFFRSGGDVVQVIYDLIPYRHPEYFIEGLATKFNRFLVRSTGFVSRYICISETTRRDLDCFLAENGSMTRTATWPLAHEFAGYRRNSRGAVASNPSVAALAGRSFVLCVGTIEIRKNGIGLLRAWQRIIDRLSGEDPILVFAGKYGWKIDGFRQLLDSDQRLSSRVRIVDGANDSDLAFLYQNCLFHTYPSLEEGWGLPVGEAAWFGKYSVVSSRSSLPEVCGNLVDYVDPTNVDELAAALEKVIRDPAYRLQKEAAIRSASLRSWNDVAFEFGRLIAGKTGV